MPYERKTYDLLVSDKLREILLEFESESIVASLLLKKRHNKEDLVDNPINFICISNEDATKVSYMTQERMAIVDESEYWTSSRRFKAKPGAFLSKIFKDISGKEVEKFSNLYKSHTTKPNFRFELVCGESIREYYYHESYEHPQRGSLGTSCMKHSSCQPYLDIYVNNQDTIKMLVMLNDDNKLMGRALLWDFDSHKIMDRIYASSDEELSFYFKKWAKENGYLHKSEQNWSNTLFFEQVGNKKQELKLRVKLNSSEFSKYPYFDTFKFIDEFGELYNYIPENVDFETLCSSDGSKYSSEYLKFDSIDKVYRYKDNSVFLTYLDIWTSRDNTEWSEINNQYILEKDCEYSQELGDYMFIGEYENLNKPKEVKVEEVEEKPKSTIRSYYEQMFGGGPFGMDVNEIIRRMRPISVDYTTSWVNEPEPQVVVQQENTEPQVVVQQENTEPQENTQENEV